jgi:hypothetical protein
MTTTRSSIVNWICVCFLFSLYGCAPIQPKTEEIDFLPEDKAEGISVALPERRYYTHKIKWAGENVARISRWYTDSESNYLQIIQANPTIDPKRIQIGDSILIPEDIMKTHEPMPQDHLRSVIPLKNKKLKPTSILKAPALPVNSLLSTEEMELFGPIYEDVKTLTPEESKTLLPLETLD